MYWLALISPINTPKVDVRGKVASVVLYEVLETQGWLDISTNDGTVAYFNRDQLTRFWHKFNWMNGGYKV